MIGTAQERSPCRFHKDRERRERVRSGPWLFREDMWSGRRSVGRTRTRTGDRFSAAEHDDKSAPISRHDGISSRSMLGDVAALTCLVERERETLQSPKSTIDQNRSHCVGAPG